MDWRDRRHVRRRILTLSPVRNLPCFGLLTLSMSLLYATFVSSLPLLVALRAYGTVSATFCLLVFLSPIAVLHPLLMRAKFLSLYGRLPIPSAICAVACFMLAINSADIMVRLLPYAFAAYGMSFGWMQAAFCRLVDLSHLSLAPPERRKANERQLTTATICNGLGATLGAPLFAGLARFSLRAPFALMAAAHAATAIASVGLMPELAWSEREHMCGPMLVRSSTRDVCLPRLTAPRQRHRHRATDRPPLLFFRCVSCHEHLKARASATIAHPWTWITGLAACFCAASLGLLRPLVLALATPPRHAADNASLQTDELHVAGMFALMAGVAGVVAPGVVALAAPRVGARPLVVVGIALTAVGFHCVLHGPRIAGLALSAGGASAVTMTALSDIACTAGLIMDGPSAPAALVTAVLLTLAEIVGTLAFPALRDLAAPHARLGHDILESALQVWRTLSLSVAILIASIFFLDFLLFKRTTSTSTSSSSTHSNAAATSSSRLVSASRNGTKYSAISSKTTTTSTASATTTTTIPLASATRQSGTPAPPHNLSGDPYFCIAMSNYPLPSRIYRR